MSYRYLPSSDYHKLKSATRRLISESGQHRQIAEQIGRKRHQIISEWANPENEERWPPIDAIADLEALRGKPYVTEALAELSGFIILPEPKSVSDAGGLSVGEVARATGQLIMGIGEAMADLEVTANELPGLRADLKTAINSLLQIGLEFDQIEGELDAEEA